MPSDSIASRYPALRVDLHELLDQCASASASLALHQSASERQHNAKVIFSKLVGHGISVYRLAPTGIVPDKAGATEFWDVSSLFCLGRALVEAFDALSYVALEEVSGEDRAFRVCLWRLHAEDRKLQALQLIKSKRPEVAAVEREVGKLRQQLSSLPFVESLDKRTRSDVLGKKIPPFHLRPYERNRRNGVDHDYYTASHILLSAHTHTYPMAVEHLATFQAGDAESLRLIALPIQYANGFLSKGLLGINGLFPNLIPSLLEPAAQIVEAWAAIVTNGISPADAE